MKLLLTSSGITNQTIRDALTDLLGKPISESNALFIPTGVYPYKYGARYAWWPVGGQMQDRLCNLGWKTLGLLELSVLPSIEKDVWLPAVQEADALLVWGGDPFFLKTWMDRSGLASLLPSLDRMVYVGVSAGSMIASTTFAETYSGPLGGIEKPAIQSDIFFSTPDGEVKRNLVVAQGLGMVDFALIAHFETQSHPDASMPNAEKWAAAVPVPVYAIDDQTAIKVSGDKVEVVSEGVWKLFPAKG